MATALHPTFSDLPRRPAPVLTITAPNGDQVRGVLDDALWGKARLLVVGGVSDAPVLDREELSDWLDFHCLDRVIPGNRGKYLAGAARWAARMQGAAA